MLPIFKGIVMGICAGLLIDLILMALPTYGSFFIFMLLAFMIFTGAGLWVLGKTVLREIDKK